MLLLCNPKVWLMFPINPDSEWFPDWLDYTAHIRQPVLAITLSWLSIEKSTSKGRRCWIVQLTVTSRLIGPISVFTCAWSVIMHENRSSHRSWTAPRVSHTNNHLSNEMYETKDGPNTYQWATGGVVILQKQLGCESVESSLITHIVEISKSALF